MNLKLGLEVEFFATKNGKIVNVGDLGLPHDEYPLLAEARGEPSSCLFKAVASVRAEIERIVYLLRQRGCRPLFANWYEKNDYVKELHEQVLRAGLNKRIAWQNAHGHSTSEKNETHVAAGMHVSFTLPSTLNYSEVVTKAAVTGERLSFNEPRTHTYNALFDFSKVFRGIESAFGEDIDKSERTRGFYELKPDGRIEYRSLPATLIHSKSFAETLARAIVL